MSRSPRNHSTDLPPAEQAFPCAYSPPRIFFLRKTFEEGIWKANSALLPAKVGTSTKNSRKRRESPIEAERIQVRKTPSSKIHASDAVELCDLYKNHLFKIGEVTTNISDIVFSFFPPLSSFNTSHLLIDLSHLEADISLRNFVSHILGFLCSQ